MHQKKYRKELGLFLVETPKVIDEFLHSAIKITEIYGLEEWIEKNKLKVDCEWHLVSPSELARLSSLQAPNQVLAVCKQPLFLEDTIDVQAPLFLYLDGISDPGNLGTIIRMADWFGLKQIFCSHTCAEAFNPKVVQSTMGSLARISIFYKTLPEVLHLTKAKQVTGTFLQGENIYTHHFKDKTLLVIGSEAHGISPENQTCITHRITIPQAKTSNTESLNAAVATSIVLSEIFRQQHHL